MVTIKFLNEASTTVAVKREFSDHKEHLLIISSFSLITIVLMIANYISTQKIPRFYYSYLVIFLLIILYFIFPTSILIIDLEKNRWDIKKMLYFIPYNHQIGKISDISRFVSYEMVDHRKKNPKSKLSYRKTKYYSSFEIWGFRDSDGNILKNIFSSRTVYIFSSHEKELRENNRIGLSLEKYFTTLKIPIEYEAIREIEH
ncbi:hypothetical protein NEF87_004818 [Candidatus Lokiarchaeum ossiferum]|uniref:Bacterial Pleckstrin homology domain-containing protein n=1 Tax=Candidatus Lokiarchaeum ossiferum TaxID=2951803 RepID=A0ABY6HYC0_9ARCH|nr:hypothetical protein NEF87_004818 [Candidatus Lokiarchaeum sp. B-35]